MCRAHKNILDILKGKPDRSGYRVSGWRVTHATVIVLIPAPAPDPALLSQTEAMLGPSQGLGDPCQPCHDIASPSTATTLVVVITAPHCDSALTTPHYVGPATVELVTGLEVWHNEGQHHTGTALTLSKLGVFVVTKTQHPAVSLHQCEILPAMYICGSTDA